MSPERWSNSVQICEFSTPQEYEVADAVVVPVEAVITTFSLYVYPLATVFVPLVER
jgi:hypothetical protein